MEYNKRFRSGSEIRLARLLDNDIKIIIPDLQRDYCWGTTICENEPDKTLAFKFGSDMLSNFNAKPKETMSLGLIYGYEVPAGHIQLCDGQQRITTLYLLLGLLNRRTKTLADRLISQRELDDNNEPYLQFAIRESSLYFMADLVNSFFLDDKIHRVEDIRKQGWYFKDYDNDPSIKSMLKALEDLERVVDNLEGESAYRFAYYLCHNLHFIYYDMQTRRQGEETFVIINTKGEPLSSTENIKPSFIDHYKTENRNVKVISDKWEEWESYFWAHRSEKNGNDTADAGMKEFFRWVSMIKYVVNGYKNSKDDKQKKEYDDLRKKGILHFHLSLFEYDELCRYFDIINQLFSSVDYLKNDAPDYLSPKSEDTVNQMNWYRVLPLIYYLNRFRNANDREIKRFSEFLKHTAKVNITRKNIQDVLPSLLEGIGNMNSSDILDLKSTGVSTMLFTDEVNVKFDLCRKKLQRDSYEDELWKAEDDDRWQGEILPLIKWAERIGNFSLTDFCDYRNTFTNLFNGKHDLDLLRRLLLVKNAPDYPCHCKEFVTSNTNKTFGNDAKTWREVISRNQDVFGDILQSLIGKPEQDYDIELQNQISAGLIGVTDAEKKLLAEKPEFLRALSHKNVQKWGNSIVLIQAKNATNAAYIRSYDWMLFVENEIKQHSLINNWTLQGYYWSNEGGCTYFHYDDKVNKILYCIDVAWSPNGYHIALFCKAGGNTHKDCNHKALRNGMQYNAESDRYVISLPIINTQLEILNYIRRLML